MSSCSTTVCLPMSVSWNRILFDLSVSPIHPDVSQFHSVQSRTWKLSRAWRRAHWKSHASFHHCLTRVPLSFGHSVSKADHSKLAVASEVLSSRECHWNVQDHRQLLCCQSPPSTQLSCLASRGLRTHWHRQNDPRSHPPDLPLQIPSHLRPPQNKRGQSLLASIPSGEMCWVLEVVPVDVLSMVPPVHLEKHDWLVVPSCCANNVSDCVPTVHTTHNNRRTDHGPWISLHSSPVCPFYLSFPCHHHRAHRACLLRLPFPRPLVMAPTSIAIGPGITE